MYLTEKRLGNLLEEVYPNNSFIHDKSVPNSNNKRYRPDYRCDELMLIVEFDGASHYQIASRILKDKEKDDDYRSLGYKVVRIPYFIQPSSITLKLWFGLDIDYEQTYLHGFIDKKAVLPADYCCLGITKFIEEITTSPVHNEVIESLKLKVEELVDIRLVLPERLVGKI